MATIIFHSDFNHVVFVSILVFQTFDQMFFGRLSFPGTSRYVVTVRHPQMVHDEKKFGNHWFSTWVGKLWATYSPLNVFVALITFLPRKCINAVINMK